MEHSVFFIKPDAYVFREQILTEIKNSFSLIHITQIKLNEELIKKLYPLDVEKPYFYAIVDYLTEKDCDLGIIEGESVMKQFLELTGLSPIPMECAPHTPRYRYGKGFEVLSNGMYITKNAIHRTKDISELITDIEIFKDFLDPRMINELT